MIGKLGDDDVRQEARTGAAARDRQAGRRCLGDGIAALAGGLGPDVAHHAEACRHIFQHFGDIFTQNAHRASARCAAIHARCRVHEHIARQMIGQRRALGFAPGLARFDLVPIDLAAHDALGMSLLGLDILKREFELVGKLRQALGRLAELHPP